MIRVNCASISRELYESEASEVVPDDEVERREQSILLAALQRTGWRRGATARQADDADVPHQADETRAAEHLTPASTPGADPCTTRAVRANNAGTQPRAHPSTELDRPAWRQPPGSLRPDPPAPVRSRP